MPEALSLSLSCCLPFRRPRTALRFYFNTRRFTLFLPTSYPELHGPSFPFHLFPGFPDSGWYPPHQAGQCRHAPVPVHLPRQGMHMEQLHLRFFLHAASATAPGSVQPSAYSISRSSISRILFFSVSEHCITLLSLFFRLYFSQADSLLLLYILLSFRA